MPRSNALVVDGTISGLLLDVDLTGVGRARQAEELAGALRASVRSGTLRAGTRLPASRTLASNAGSS